MVEKMKKSCCARIFTVFLVIILSGSVATASSYSGVISGLVATNYEDGWIVKMSAMPSGNIPACATSTSGSLHSGQFQYVIDTTSHRGRAMIATIMMAFAGNKRVTFWGTSVCDKNLDPNTEVLSQVLVNP